MIYCDGGSTYTKLLDHNGKIKIIATKELIKDRNRWFDIATGHSMKNYCGTYVNELVALAHGSLALVPDNNFTVVDIGSRDTKYIIVKDRQVSSLDWNTSCGGNLGFTLELLGQFYHLSYDYLLPNQEKVPVACGLLGIEKIFDEINRGLTPEDGVAKFIHGMALNIYQFCQSPSTLYLSGGLAENKCFVKTLEKYCTINTLGRDVLLKGLVEIAKGT
ncbi:MAG: ATPase [Bacillota bacterium]